MMAESVSYALCISRGSLPGDFEGISQQELREAARFFHKLGRAELRGKLRREAEGLRLELRYFKASSNGLMKGLKDVVWLPIDA
jgi:hypothetical protein